ncbi:MAG TPA: Hsp33 family molecular chaperone HslO [Patescibacteria group bacterium]|nr:Hsp33 family molecular chaperone HslO [Patescibacteria group bacterium]
MHDHLIRVTAPGVRAFAAVTTQLTEEARRRHNCYPVAAAALGRTMTAALLMAANLKTTEESITVRIKGDGPLGEIVADACAAGSVRGYVRHPQIDLPLRGGKLDVGGAVGAGQLNVTRFNDRKQPFTGTCDLVSGEIAEDVTQYLTVSEQTPSSVGLGVLVQPDLSVSAAGGFILQVMPGITEEVLERLEKNLSVLPSVTNILSARPEAQALTELLFDGLPTTFHDSMPVQFQCTCTRQRVQNMLVSLGQTEVASMHDEGKAEIICHFCGEKYFFTQEELGYTLSLLNNNEVQ